MLINNHVNIEQSALCFHSTFDNIDVNNGRSGYDGDSSQEYIYCKSTIKTKEGNTECLNEYKGLYGDIVYQTVVHLPFSEFYGIPTNTSRSAKHFQNLLSCVLISRYKGHPTQKSFLRCSYDRNEDLNFNQNDSFHNLLVCYCPLTC